MSTVEVPKNIDFTLTSKINKLIYDKLEITNMAGIIKVVEGKVVMEKLFMNLLQGSMSLTGEYNTQDMKNPFADFNFDMKDIDIPSSYSAFNTVQKMAPIAENAKGRVSVILVFKTLLDAHMSPLLNTMNGNGKLTSKEIEINNSKAFTKIADAVKNDKLKNIKAKDVNLSFKIRDGRIYVDPFVTKISDNKVTIFGDQGLDQTMNYVMQMPLPASSLGGGQLGTVVGKGLSAVNANILIQGTFNDPKIGVKLTAGENKELKEAAKEEVKKVVAEKKAEVKAEASKKAQEILAKAQKDADAVKAASKQAADAVRKESNDNANKLVSEASNPIAKAVAKKGAEKMKKEGEEKAKKIETEGNQKSDVIMKKAQEEANKLK
jgi:NADH dehydrogenase/NADH:ubiquinone oxidoreductase subunit G